MRSILLFSLWLSAAVLVVGCSSTSSQVDSTGERGPADTSVVYTQAIHVLVDGQDRGMIPQTVRIRRSFGTQEVSLWQAGKEIRIYELEIATTTEGRHTLQGFWSTPSADGASFDVSTLPKRGENTYQIPYAAYPLRIEDNQYGVTLLVSD